METAIKMVMVVIIMVTMGEAKDDVENIVKEMRMEMHAVYERLALTEEKLMKELNKTQGELLELKNENFI